MEELQKYLSNYEIISVYDLGDVWVAQNCDPGDDPEEVFDNLVEVNKTTGKILGFSPMFDPRADEVNRKTLIYER